MSIITAEEHPDQFPHFKKMVDHCQNAKLYTKSLVPSTKYEISIVGHFPQERFMKLNELLTNVLYLITFGSKEQPMLSQFTPAFKDMAKQRRDLVSLDCHQSLLTIYSDDRP